MDPKELKELAEDIHTLAYTTADDAEEVERDIATIAEKIKRYAIKQVEKSQSLKRPLSVREQELLDAYSKFLEEHNYIDSDWWAEHPGAIESFVAELGNYDITNP